MLSSARGRIVSIALTSDRSRRRVGALPLMLAIGLSWGFVVAWLIAAVMASALYFAWGILLACTTLTFAFLISCMGLSLIRDANRDYSVELNQSEIVLTVHDRARKTKGVIMVLLDDVLYAEYYPYPDSASIILHTPYNHLEIPLWPMQGAGADVVAYLEGRGVRIVNVQSDDVIPD
jgi:hypothetical protein